MHSLSPVLLFFFASRRRHTSCSRDWSSDVCSSDLFPPLQHLLADLLASQRLEADVVGVLLCQPQELPLEVDGGDGTAVHELDGGAARSEERRVGKEGRSRWSPDP